MEAFEPIKYRETIKPKGERPKKLTLEERALLLLIKEISHSRCFIECGSMG